MGNVITSKSETEHVHGLTQASHNQKKNIMIAWPSESYPSVPFCNVKYNIKEKGCSCFVLLHKVKFLLSRNVYLAHFVSQTLCVWPLQGAQ